MLSNTRSNFASYGLLALLAATCLGIGLLGAIAASAAGAAEGVPDAIRTYDPQIASAAHKAQHAASARTAAGSISGTLYQTDGATPITSGAWVSVLNPTTGLFAAGTTVSSDGTYTVGGLSADTYIVRAEGTAYALEFYSNAGANGSAATPVTVGSGDTPSIDFTLDLGGTITGTVYAADGTTPLADVNVGLQGGWLGTCTDSGGNFTINSVPLGTAIKVFAGGSSWCPNGSSSFQREWWQEASGSAGATSITLSNGSPSATNIDFTLADGGAISGFIFEADGTTPITSSIGISALSPNSNGTGTGSSVTVFSDGSYIISGLVTGSYIVKAEGADYAIEFYDEAGLSGTAATVIDVTTGNTTSGVNFTLDPGGTISGIAYAADGTTTLNNINIGIEGTWINVCTDAAGAYTLLGVPHDRQIKVYAGGVNWCRNNLHEFSRQYWQLANNTLLGTPITLDSSAPDATGIDFNLDRAYFVRLPIVFR